MAHLSHQGQDFQQRMVVSLLGFSASCTSGGMLPWRTAKEDLCTDGFSPPKAQVRRSDQQVRQLDQPDAAL